MDDFMFSKICRGSDTIIHPIQNRVLGFRREKQQRTYEYDKGKELNKKRTLKGLESRYLFLVFRIWFNYSFKFRKNIYKCVRWSQKGMDSRPYVPDSSLNLHPNFPEKFKILIIIIEKVLANQNIVYNPLVND